MSEQGGSRLSEAVADEVRVLLARKRSNATKLAQQIGWTQQYLSRRMVGAQPFDLDDLQAIAHALGVGVADLLPREAREKVTLTFPTDLPPFVPDLPPAPPVTVTGTRAWPDHPVLAGMVPLQRRPADGPPPTPTRTAPTGR